MEKNKLSDELSSFPRNRKMSQESKDKITAALQDEMDKGPGKTRNFNRVKGAIAAIAGIAAVMLFSFFLVTENGFQLDRGEKQFTASSGLKLAEAEVDLSNEDGAIEVMYGEKKGEIFYPLSLKYNFTLVKTGEKPIGGMEKPDPANFTHKDGIKLEILPSERLQEVSEEVMGFNLFDEKEMANARLGGGRSAVPKLEPNDTGSYSLNYDLGALEENPEMRLAPSPEKLKKLLNHALDAVLVVTVEGGEVGRYDLSRLAMAEFTLEAAVTKLTDEEYDKTGTTGLNDPVKEDFRKLIFDLKNNIPEDVTSVDVTVPDAREWKDFINSHGEDRHWYANGGGNEKHSMHESVFYSKGMNEKQIREAFNDARISMSWKTEEGVSVEKRFSLGGLLNIE